jgi:hypothetical protein
MLEEFFMSVFENEGPNGMLLQQDRVPPHFQKEMMDFLNCEFSKRWIDRGGPITWPPC